MSNIHASIAHSGPNAATRRACTGRPSKGASLAFENALIVSAPMKPAASVCWLIFTKPVSDATRLIPASISTNRIPLPCWLMSQMVMRLRRRGGQIELATLARIETGQRSIADNELHLLLTVLGKKWADLD